MLSPGGENEGGDTNTNNDGSEINDPLPSETKEKGKEKTSIFKKIHDALQDWSNGDQHEQEIDDLRP